MEEIMDLFSELCLDLSDELRNEYEWIKKQELLKTHLGKVTNFGETFRVPDFKPGLEWLNVTEPLSLNTHLKGKLVILDFFTYCCINCMHILPELKLLEQEFTIEDGLVVVGVHNAKFENERVTSNIEEAVRRYGITHPVVNDVFEGMWKNLGVNCWPTIYILGPNSKPLLVVQGEGHYKILREFVKEAIEFYKRSGEISNGSLLQLNNNYCQNSILSKVSNSILLYPGKITAHPSKEILAISDTSHHRILLITPEGYILEEIGGLNPGFGDGNFSTARFSSPQGTDFRENKLYVADTDNHAIRIVDLTLKTVETLFGVDGGQQKILLSPWDLIFISDIDALVVAMAGTHELWGYFFRDTDLWNKSHKRESCSVIVGSGREENRNNQYPLASGLAQPSGLSFDLSSKVIYVADSESSTIRCVSLSNGAVTNIVGGAMDPRNLFAFGDKDGIGMEAKLQHPLGVAWSPFDDHVYVADSYNHKLKVINKKNRSCSTLDYLPKLNEPGGLCAIGDKIYIADTNNHLIKTLHLSSKKLETVDIVFQKDTTILPPSINIRKVEISSGGGELHIKLELTLPEKYKLTPDSPSRWIIDLPGNRTITSHEFTLTPKWKLQLREEDFCSVVEKKIFIKCRVFICNHTKCSVEELSIPVQVCFNKSFPKETSLQFSFTLTPPTMT